MSVTPTAAETAALELVKALEGHDPERALRGFAPDAEIDVVPARLRGAAADVGRAYFEALTRAFPDLLVHIRSSMGAADLAVLEVKLEGTQAADFLEVNNQEKHLDVDQAWMVWVAGGKIARLRVYGCQNQLYRRLAVKRLDRISITG